MLTACILSAPTVEYFKCDLMDEDSISSCAQEIRAKWGDPTVLCAIAGIVRGKPLLGESYALQLSRSYILTLPLTYTEATKRDLDMSVNPRFITLFTLHH